MPSVARQGTNCETAVFVTVLGGGDWLSGSPFQGIQFLFLFF